MEHNQNFKQDEDMQLDNLSKVTVINQVMNIQMMMDTNMEQKKQAGNPIGICYWLY